MARKSVARPAKKQKLQLSLSEDVILKFKLAALSSKMDLSEFFAAWINREFSGIHVRGFDKARPVGQGMPINHDVTGDAPRD